MSDIKIHIKAKKVVVNEQGTIKLTREAAAIAAKVATDTGRPVKQVVSEIIIQTYQNGLICPEREPGCEGLILDEEDEE